MNRMHGIRLCIWCALALSAMCVAAVRSAEPAPAFDRQLYEQTVTRAIQYFQSKGQAEDGSYSAQAGPAVTALVTTGILRTGRSVDDPLVAKSLKYLEGFVQPDGSVANPQSAYKNYETCLAILCFSEANKDGRYNKPLEEGRRLRQGRAMGRSEGHDKASFSYGGAGYGSKKRPDLSNTSFLIDALQGGRQRCQRRSHSEGPGLRLPLPEPGDRAQHDALLRQEPRRRFLLHHRRRRPEHGRRDRRRRPAELRLDDLRRPQEHDLRRRRPR